MNYELRIRNYGLIILVIVGILLPGFSFCQTQPITPPENLEEVKEMGEKAFKTSEKELPGTLEKIWKEEVLPIWQRMYDWFKKTVWDPCLGPFFQREIEKRKPEIKEGFEKEKKEMKEEVKTELPKVGKSLWERFKEAFK